ncbi:MAG: PhoH family protein [Sideroxyarcus sp.]|nr:PhoH family protein [Sideroxyarcus sp.]
MKDAVNLSFEPVDNARLANLCGAFDENLRQIEIALEVNIARRGERFNITGDVTQIDLARGQKSGLNDARVVLKDVRGIAFQDFLAEDVVRHPLVQKIVSAYEKHEQQKP